MAYVTPEGKISKEIYDYLLKRKIFQKRNHATTSSYGLPDREFLYKGVCVGIEIKQEDGRVKKHQQKKLDLYNSNGGIGVAVRSVDEVKFLVDMIDNMMNNNHQVDFIKQQFNRRFGKGEN